MKKDIERIGERKNYKGTFRLFHTDNLFNYVVGKLTHGGMFKLGKVRPRVDLNEKGTYVGEGLFAISNGDLFIE